MRAQARLQELYRQLDLDEKARSETYEVVQGKNDWLKDFKGMTYTDKLHRALTRGIFEEHAKFSDGSVSNIEKAMAYCLDPKTKEIMGVGGSSLLRGKKTGRIIPDLLLNNFGLWWAGMLRAPATTTTFVNLVQESGVSEQVNMFGAGGNMFNCPVSTDAVGTEIQMGSSMTAPQRTDYKIGTALANSPESTSLLTNTGAYTSSNTIVVQADANPTGGAGAVNEMIFYAIWYSVGAAVNVAIALAHDSITPTVNYSSGFLLRGAYTWQI